jgi:hypothetical protein
MAFHALADDLAFEDVESGEQGRGAVPFAVVGDCAGAPLLHWQARLGAVERLDLALLIDRQDDGVVRRIDIEPDDVAQFGDELRVIRQLELTQARLDAPAISYSRSAACGRISADMISGLQDAAGATFAVSWQVQSVGE